MDVEGFFAGFGASMETNAVFTDRHSFVAQFHERALRHCAERWPVQRLTDFTRGAENVMSIIGEGGLGKSSLVRHLASLAEEGALRDLPPDVALAVIDYADVGSRSVESMLMRMRAGFASFGDAFPTFDLTLAAYWARKHPGEPLVEFLRSGGSISRTDQSLAVGDHLAAAADALALGGFGIVGFSKRAVTAGASAAKRLQTLKRVREELPVFDAVVNSEDPDQMAGFLPLFLAYDLERLRGRRSVMPICVLDTLEDVQAPTASRGGLEDIISRFVYLLPNVFFLAASRRALTWYDPVHSAGLFYNKPQHWYSLRPDASRPAQVSLLALEPHYADEYLRSRLTAGGAPVIPADVRSKIVDGAQGSPLYLQLSADRYADLSSGGATPSPTEFGGPLPELVIRIMRDLDAVARDLLRAASLFRAFDDEVLHAAVPRARGSEVADFCNRSFVLHDDAGWPAFRLPEQLRTCVRACDQFSGDPWTARERHQALDRVAEHLAETTSRIWQSNDLTAGRVAELSTRSVASFLLTLEAARDYERPFPSLAASAHALYELGHRQVLATLQQSAPPAHDTLAAFIEVARCSASVNTDARRIYGRLSELSELEPAGPHHILAELHRGITAMVFGDLATAERHFAPLVNQPEPIASSAVLGLAGCAQRESRFAAHAAHTARLSRSRLDSIRSADTLGHLYMHNGLFDRAIASFETARTLAEEASAPLWVARAVRHLALAAMWTSPAKAEEALTEARRLNDELMDATGLAQCDMVAAMVASSRSRWGEAWALLESAKELLAARGATFELIPPDVVEVLIALRAGRSSHARGVAERVVDAARSGRPVGPPVWLAVLAVWLGEPSWFDVDSLDWIDATEARARWRSTLGVAL